jgi:hypothetical protein
MDEMEFRRRADAAIEDRKQSLIRAKDHNPLHSTLDDFWSFA